MTRFTLATSFLLATTTTASAQNSDAWSYLTVTLPTPLSDMSVVTLPESGGDDADAAKKRIIITGGCDSPDGNVYKDVGGGYFECASLSDKAYAFDPIHPHSQFQAWNGEFKTLNDMPRKRFRHASAVINGNVCVFGGRNETDALIAEVDCYDPTSDEWSTPSSLPEQYQSSDFTAFTKGTDVYLVGGYDPMYTALNQVTIADMADFDNVSYKAGSKLGTRRGDIDVAVLENGDVYVSGGFTHENEYKEPLNSVEKYDATMKKWSNVNSLNEERGDKQLVALNGKVYAIGGEDKVDVSGIPENELGDLGARSIVLDSVEVLDPTEDVHGGMAEWRSLAGMPGQLFRFAASEWEVEGDGEEEKGYIFAFGGQVAYESECECFRTTDKVMVFDVGRAEEELESLDLGSGSGAAGMALIGSGIVGSLSFAVVGLFWFML
mmetsp:Transcript_25827/g.53932  ORF Transcript_25827/g.53932 Transcript_25827/m.53932 type:complete len:436 (-) Transcript_25827:133-1440(-)